ncbi:MAG TPA: alpha-L-fucosidase [Puia sp.]|nr:alpha-L-fucosidase [Puia sp.]
MNKIIGPLLFLSVSALAQETATPSKGKGGVAPEQGQAAIGKNYVAILPGDSEEDIIRKAARVAPSPRQLRWQELELTAFFHFGINSFTDREWGTGKDDIHLFNPANLDAKQWVSVAAAAGIRQVILTCKHHDGFCLWPTKYTEHSVQYTPWKNGKGDVVKEVSEACHASKMGFGVYLSPWDRNCPFYGDSEKYNRYFEDQLTELLTHYGKVDEVWFDGANGEGPDGKKPVYDFAAWYKLIRRLQPGAIIAIMGPDVRWVGTESGQGRLTEWSVLPVDQQMQDRIASGSQRDMSFVPQGDLTDNDLGSRAKLAGAKGLIWYPAETDVSIRPGWFYHPAEDDKVKSPDALMDIYFSSVGRNSVLLLNIPPDKNGLIHENDISSLKGWKKKIDATFAVNLAKGANFPDTATTIDLSWKEARTFDVLLLQEKIRLGQRIEGFDLEYKDAEGWKKITEGTTVGYKRLLRFPAVTAGRVRLRILSSRLKPALAKFGLYKIVE